MAAVAPPPPPPPPPLPGSGKKKSSSGLWDTISSIPGDILHDAESIVSGFVPGLIQTGKSIGLDIADVAHGDVNFNRSLGIAEGMVKAVAEDLRHPLRHPANTILDLWGIASGGAGLAARVGAVSRAAATGEGVARAALLGPGPETRMFGLPDLPADLTPTGTYSRNAIIRQGQKALDAKRMENPDARIGLRTQRDIVGKKIVKQQYAMPQQIERAAAVELEALGKKLSAPQKMALRLYAENVPVEERLAYHDGLIGELDKLSARNTQRASALMEAAKEYVHTVDGKVEWKPGTEKLQEVYGKMEQVVSKRETDLVRHNLMTQEVIASRRNSPGRITRGARRYTQEKAQRDLKFLEGRLKQNDVETKALMDELSGLRVGTTRTVDAANRLDAAGKKAARIRVRSASAAKNDLAAANARLSRLQERIAADQAILDEYASLHASGQLEIVANKFDEIQAIQNRYEANVRKYVQAHKRKVVAETIIAVKKTKDKQRAAEIVRQAENEMKVSRDLQQSFIMLTQSRLKTLGEQKLNIAEAMGQIQANAGKLVGGNPFDQGRMYVPYDNKAAAGAIYRIAGLGARGSVGIPKKPGWLKPFSGGSMRNASGFGDPVKLVAQRSHDGIRFVALVKFRNQIVGLSREVPRYDDGTPMRNPVAIRMKTGEPFPDGVKQILSKVEADKTLTKQERELLGMSYNELVDELFDRNAAKTIDKLTIEPNENVRWIEKEMLGGLDEPSPMVGLEAGAGRIVLKSVDNINNVTKFATLYLRPATIVPNVLSGVALNLIQQGFLAPANIGKAFALHWKMKPGARAIMDQVMGEGKAAQLAADRGILNEAISKAANVYGVIQDLPFRRSAFLHEARREGFKTVKDVERLLMDESQRDVLFRIADRANSAIIDYSRLGRFERSVLRRVLYFYPWLKGATVYSAYALGEHPLQAMTAGVLGQQAQAQSDATFGDLPSWAHGLFKVGERNGMPVTINPSNILPFTTGSDIAQTLSGMIAGKTPSAQNLEGNLSPAAAAFLTALTGRSSLGAQLPQRGFAEQFGRSLVENTPAAALVKRLTTDQSGKSYPTSTTEAILQYILGPAVSGRTTNVGVLNSLAAKEQSGR